MHNLFRNLPKDTEFHNNVRKLIQERKKCRENFIKMLSEENVDKDILNRQLNKIIIIESKISKITGNYMIKCRFNQGSDIFGNSQKRNHKQRRKNEKD
jgi:hypothetical protein